MNFEYCVLQKTAALQNRAGKSFQERAEWDFHISKQFRTGFY